MQWIMMCSINRETQNQEFLHILVWCQNAYEVAAKKRYCFRSEITKKWQAKSQIRQIHLVTTYKNFFFPYGLSRWKYRFPQSPCQSTHVEHKTVEQFKCIRTEKWRDVCHKKCPNSSIIWCSVKRLIVNRISCYPTHFSISYYVELIFHTKIFLVVRDQSKCSNENGFGMENCLWSGIKRRTNWG